MIKIIPLMKYFLAAITICLFITSTSAQNVESTIALYADKYPQEKTYLHYDKSSYGAGQTVWFKAYLMSGIMPADESKTFYVDWTDDKGKLLEHGVYPVIQASASGQFDIPANYKGDYIHVKAYTKWMLNFDTAFIYQKDIRVLQPKAPAAANAPKPAVIPTLQFFPEGGDAVAELSNKIAFKANDQWGRPVKIKGVVVDSKGQVIDSLRPRHDGMGFFYILPQSNETYTAKWKDEKGKDYTTPLPVAKKEGITLQVASAGDKRTVVINSNLAALKTQPTIHVLGTMNQNQAFKVTRDISAGNTRLVIPTADLPTGILTITVFDDQWKPLAERITFVNNNEAIFKPTVNVDHWGLSQRARNKVDIMLPDTMFTNLSISVTDIGIDSDSSDNIISHLLLASEIKGQVYKPAYYFSATSDTINQHLDLVMLTHGWRRFKWDEVVAGKTPSLIYQRDTSYLSIGGRVYGVNQALFRDAGEIILMIKPMEGQKEGQSLLLPIGTDGTFGDPNVLLFDSVRIYYQLSQKKGLRDASVKFMENLLPPLRNNQAANGLYSQQWDTSGMARNRLLADEAAKLLANAEGKMLDNVVIKSKTKTKVEQMDEKYTSAFFKGDGMQFDITEDPAALGAMTIFNYLQGRVAGLQISTGGPGGNTSLQWRGGSPQLYLDEMPTEPDQIQSVPVADIAYVKVFRPPFMGGFNGANGAIAVYTRRGGDIKSTPGSGLANEKVVGYSLIKQFYSPNYDSYKKENESRDLRTTLYWNPQLRAGGKDRKVSVTFHNNDVSEAFRVVIEGMTGDGRLAHVEYVME